MLLDFLEHEDHQTLFDCFLDIMRDVFNIKSNSKPNLLGKATLAIDRGYMRVAILAWWLETGGDILDTVMRGQGFVPFTFGKEKKNNSNSSGNNNNNSDDEVQVQNIPLDSAKIVHQKTAFHNLGRRGNNSRALTCMAYASGMSSTVAMFLSSRDHGIQWDIVLAKRMESKRMTTMPIATRTLWTMTTAKTVLLYLGLLLVTKTKRRHPFHRREVIVLR